MNFGDKIHQIRMSRSLTQKQFGDSLGVSGQAVSKWERNMGNPSLEVISNISKNFDVSIEELMNKKIKIMGVNAKTKKKKNKSNKILNDILKSKKSIENSDENLQKYQFFDGYLECYAGDEKKAYIPNGLVTIGDGAFFNNKLVEEVVIPDSIVDIKEQAFYGCDNLKILYVKGMETKFDESVFDNTDNLVIQCPAGSCAEKYANKYGINCKNI